MMMHPASGEGKGAGSGAELSWCCEPAKMMRVCGKAPSILLSELLQGGPLSNMYQDTVSLWKRGN
jgi:hypothetical protein